MEIRNLTGAFAIVTRHVALTFITRRDRKRVGLRIGRTTYWVKGLKT
jgi:hypothetical protein